jgi:UDP-N-acetylglucosamine--N-acetylmuramyl-(pentapeptide) pyrophosphoryl-undecaprenol N-acetylglucosamine transferase
MKALFVVTGRGIGGDAVTALNIAHALSKYGVECEFALDHSAPGLLFKRNGLTWHKTSIPQAGGHAATKKSLAKAAFKTSKASLETARLCRKIRPQVVVGVIGGGAVIGSLSAQLTRIPSVGISNTPTDAKVCANITTTVALPESKLFQMDLKNKNIFKAYSPVNPQVVVGDKEKALKLLPPNFDENKPTILFSSGSTLFEKTALAAEKVGKSGLDANILVVGHPLEDKYLDYLKGNKVMYLGYIDWIQDLYKTVDLAVLSDDGVMIHEAIACQMPIIALIGVKYGRYHNLAAMFKGAVLESDLENIEQVIQDAFSGMDEMKENTRKYSSDVLKSSDRIARIIYQQIKDKK